MLDVYHEKVANKELDADSYQLKVAEALEELNRKIAKYTPAKPAGFFGKVAVELSTASLISSPKCKMFILIILQLFKSSKDEVRAPKGLYLYGTVGCGKTMLMDMFYDHCLVESSAKRRVHFHSFMLDVHHSMCRVS